MMDSFLLTLFECEKLNFIYKVPIDSCKLYVYHQQASSRQGNPNAHEAAAPNSILFIENLPHETTSAMLELLFKQYPGFREVRLIEAKPGIAFVEFEDDIHSSMAMTALQGFRITPQNSMAISFAKK